MTQYTVCDSHFLLRAQTKTLHYQNAALIINILHHIFIPWYIHNTHVQIQQKKERHPTAADVETSLIQIIRGSTLGHVSNVHGRSGTCARARVHGHVCTGRGTVRVTELLTTLPLFSTWDHSLLRLLQKATTFVVTCKLQYTVNVTPTRESEGQVCIRATHHM